jgi:hypothetical protein
MKPFLASSLVLGLAVAVLLLVLPMFLEGYQPAKAQWVDAAPAELEGWVDIGPVLPFMRTPEEVVLAGELLLPGSLVGINDVELRFLRNTVFARHGFDFGDKLLTEYFLDRPWGYKPDPEYTEDRLTLADQQNLGILLQAEGDWEAAHRQGQVVIMQQVEEASKTAGSLEILDAFLTDKGALATGTAPEGFELQSLDYYKTEGIKDPLTLANASPELSEE